MIRATGLYQVVIGNDVHEVYAELEKLGVQTGGAVPETAPVKGPVTLTSLGNSLIGTVSGVFTPIMAGLLGMGLTKGLLAILTLIFPGWAASGDMSYTILNAAGDTLVYFLPLLVAFTAAQKFGCDPIVGAIIGGALVYPSIVTLYPMGPWGLNKFLGLDILVMMQYSGTVLPSIIAVYCASKVYKGLRNSLPSSVKNLFAPFLTIVIIVPLTFLIVGPAFGVVGLGIQTAASALAEWQFIGPILLGLIMGGFYQVLVIFGLHWAIVPILFMEISQVNPVWNAGVTTVTAYNQIAVIAQVGAVFAIAIRVRNPARKSAAIAAGITGIFGITEPVIYGFTLPKKTPFFFACLSGAVFGALAGFAGNFISNGHGIAWQFGGTGIFTYPAYLIPGFDGSVANLLIVLAASILSVGTTFILTYATYKPDAAEMDTGEVVIETSRVDKTSAKKVFAPVKGRVLPITQSADPSHREEAVGKGVCFMPLCGKIYAPFDGIVEMVFDTKHAINIKSESGIEALIHCGIDTVELNGKGFTTRVQEGQKVTAGQLVLEYDKDIIARLGYNLETQLVITNTGDYKAITQAKSGECAVGDIVLYVE